MKADMDKACPHANTEAAVEVVLLEDTGLRQLNLRVWCSDCIMPFVFPDGMAAGVDLHGVTQSADRQELRVAITSASDVPEGLTL